MGQNFVVDGDDATIVAELEAEAEVGDSGQENFRDAGNSLPDMHSIGGMAKKMAGSVAAVQNETAGAYMHPIPEREALKLSAQISSSSFFFLHSASQISAS